MKKYSFTYQSIALILAMLMFLTSVGYIVDLHYCQGELKTFKVFGKAKTCHEIGQGKKECPHHKKALVTSGEEKTSLNKKDCCSNQMRYVQMDKDQQYPVKLILKGNISLQYFVIAFVDTFLKEPLVETELLSHTYYKNPLIPRDIYVLLETYLL